MQTAALLTLAVALAAGLALAVLRLRFRHSPTYLWRERVRRRVADLRAEATGPHLSVRRAAGEAALAEAEKLARLADDVTFWNHLFHRHVPGLTADLLNRPLPEPTPAGAAPPPAEHPHLVKLRAFARFGLMAARADGRVAKAERAVVRDFLGRAFGHDPVLVRHIDPQMERAEEAAPTEPDAVAAVLAVADATERQELLALAAAVFDSSGERNEREQGMLTRLTGALVIGPGSAPPAPPAPVPEGQPDPRLVLDILPGTELTPDLIRRRYTLLTEKADPAKAAALGAEFEQMALRKRANIRQAAEALIAPFGVPLDPPPGPPPPADPRHNPDLDDAFGM
jgi:uncharacterized tellurite resistance protein B-like protein